MDTIHLDSLIARQLDFKQSKPPYSTRSGGLPFSQYFYFYGKVISAGEFGNINYGYVGAALALPNEEIYFAGGGVIHQVTGTLRGEGLRLDYYTTYFDDPEDFVLVQQGINIYYRLNP